MGKVSFVVSGFDEFDCFTVGSLVAFVDTHDPTFGGKCFGEVVQFEVFVTGVGVSDVVVTFWLAVLGVNLPGAVVAEFVHEAVLHGGEHHVVDSVAVAGDVVFLLDVGVDSTSDPHHPEELVDIVAGVSAHSAVDDQHVVDVKFIANLEGLVLG